MTCLVWSLWLTLAPLSVDNCQQAQQVHFLPSMHPLAGWSMASLRAPLKSDKSSGRRSFIWPVEAHEISSAFGLRLHPLLGRFIAHKGIDISVPSGSGVHAVAAGVVEKVGHEPRAGRYLEIRHSGGWSSRYFHLSSVRVSKGETLAAGEEIARSGNSGQTTGPHLHLEIGYKGRPVNPLPLLNGGALSSVALASDAGKTALKAQHPRVVVISQGASGIRISVRFNNKIATVAPGSKVFGDYKVIKQASGKYHIIPAV